MHDDCDSSNEEEEEEQDHSRSKKITTDLPKINGCDLKQRTNASDSGIKNRNKKQNSQVQSSQKVASSTQCTDSTEDKTSNIKVHIAIAAAFSDSMPVRIDEVLYAWNVIMCLPYVLTCFNSCVGI